MKAIKIIFTISTFACLLASFLYWTFNPKLSQMEVFFKFFVWVMINVLAIVLIEIKQNNKK